VAAPFGDGALEHRLRIAQRARQRIKADGADGAGVAAGRIGRGTYNFAVMDHPPIIYRPLSFGEHRMSSSNDEDSQQRFALGFLFALIALVVFTVVGFATFNYGMGGATVQDSGLPVTQVEPAEAPVPGPGSTVTTEIVTVVVPEGASIQVVGGVVNFYFATGSADLAPGAAEALATVIQGIQSGRKAVISGFHDTTGDPKINEELAKLRAQTVRDVLVGLGVAAEKVDLLKPAVSTGSGNNAQARRVEVKLLD
jgi:outer membrane protein OmpA-like peptidoglycan-associated protein